MNEDQSVNVSNITSIRIRDHYPNKNLLSHSDAIVWDKYRNFKFHTYSQRRVLRHCFPQEVLSFSR
jgi:hypothetical protein